MKAKNVKEAYDYTRGRGHTQALCNAARECNAFVVFANHQQAADAKRRYGIDSITVDQLPEKVMGTNRPIFFDNHTVYVLAREAVASELVAKAGRKALEAIQIAILNYKDDVRGLL